MGDRTNIADALDKFDHCTGGWVCPAVAHFHGCHCDDGNCDRPAEHTAVPLRADPDTSDELFTEARRLLDAATPGPWTHPSPTANWFTTPQPIQIDEADWGQETQEGGAMCGYRIGTLADERAWRYADVELIAAAPRLIAALLAERDADVSAGAVARTVAMSHIAAERDAERAARERAEAEARQLREAIRAHENLHRPDGPDGADGPIEMDGWPCCNDDRLLWAAAVAEVAEDRGQTHTQGGGSDG